MVPKLQIPPLWPAFPSHKTLLFIQILLLVPIVLGFHFLLLIAFKMSQYLGTPHREVTLGHHTPAFSIHIILPQLDVHFGQFSYIKTVAKNRPIYNLISHFLLAQGMFLND